MSGTQNPEAQPFVDNTILYAGKLNQALSSKVNASSGQASGLALTGAAIDATSTINGASAALIASLPTQAVASVTAFMALTGNPQQVFLESWDGTAATSAAAGFFTLVSASAPAGKVTDGGVDFVLNNGAYYTRLGVNGGADPAWYGAIGDGTSHPASQIFTALSQLQVFFPNAYSLNQERDWLAVQAVCSNVRGVASPTRHYMMANTAVAQDDNPLIWISGITHGDLTDSTLDFTALVAVTTVIEHMPDSDFSATSNIPWGNSSAYAPTQYTNTIFTGQNGASYTDPTTTAQWTGTLSNGTMTVSNFTGAPALKVGDTIYDSGWLLNAPTITAMGSGTGGNGTYTLSDSKTTITASQNITMATSTGHYTQWGQPVTLQPGFYTMTLDYSLLLGASIDNGNQQPVNLGLYFGTTSPSNPGGSPWGQGYVSLQAPTLSATVPLTGNLSFSFGVTETSTSWPSVSLSGYGSFTIPKFSITTLHKNCAIYSTRDGSPEHYPNPVPMRGFELVGPGPASGITGIWYNSFQNQDGTIMNLAQCGINNFQIGILFQNGAYLSEYWDVGVGSCGICLSFPPGSVNAGENFRWFGGGLSNSGSMIDNPGSAEFTFFSTTLDYSDQCITNNAGRIDIFGSHMEMQGPGKANRPLYHCIGSGTINVKGGMFLGAGNGANYKWPPVQLDTNMAAMTFDGTQVYNLTCNTGWALSGPGTLKLRNLINTGNMNIGRFDNASSDILGLSGQFFTQGKSILCQDGIGMIGGLFSDVVAPIDQWTSEGASVAISTEYLFGQGQFSLKVTTQGQSRNDRIVFCFPIEKFQTGSYQISMLFPKNMTSNANPAQQSTSTTHGGNTNLSTYYDGYTADGTDGTPNTVVYARAVLAKIIGYDAFGRPKFGGTDRFAGETDFRLTQAGNIDWMTGGFACNYLGQPLEISPNTIGQYAAGAPAFADHVVIVLDTESLPATEFYIGAVMGNPW